MKEIEIVSVFHSGDRRPNFVPGPVWDQAEHYFTDYLWTERGRYSLPDGYFVAEDVCGAKHIYDPSGDPCELFRHFCGGEYHPAVFAGYGDVVVFSRVKN